MHEVNANNQIIKTYIKKEHIEQAIADYNTTHYSQALNTPMHQDRIYPKLQQDETRNTILDGTLGRENCDNEDIYQFLKLLKTNRRNLLNR